MIVLSAIIDEEDGEVIVQIGDIKDLNIFCT